MIKKYFLTGLVILLPLAVTIAIVFFILNFLTQPFVGFFEHFLKGFSDYEKYQTLIHFFLQIFLLFALFFFTVLLGFLARLIVVKYFINVYDYVLHRIPVIRTVYKASQQLIKTIFGGSSRSFKQVVLVPFPLKGAYAIGLISGPAPQICEATLDAELVNVFVPTTPNPTSGYLMLYRKEEVIYLDMKVEEAFKYIISCGVITSGSDENSQNKS